MADWLMAGSSRDAWWRGLSFGQGRASSGASRADWIMAGGSKAVWCRGLPWGHGRESSGVCGSEPAWLGEGSGRRGVRGAAGSSAGRWRLGCREDIGRRSGMTQRVLQSASGRDDDVAALVGKGGDEYVAGPAWSMWIAGSPRAC